MRLRRPRRTRIVALAGDDAGLVQSHAEALRDTLDRLGFDAVVAPSQTAVSARSVRAADVVGSWRPVWQRLGRGEVLIRSMSPRGRARAGRLAPRALRTFVFEPAGRAGIREDERTSILDERRPRTDLCAQIAEETWRALTHRTAVGAFARRLRARLRMSRQPS